MFLAVQIEGHSRVITSLRATWICQYSVCRVKHVVYKNSIQVENKDFFLANLRQTTVSLLDILDKNVAVCP